ncbi:MAG: hypothetical protein ACI8QC_003136 [Planctomycetota bacterium]|jgi:hypothetical protein
MSSPDSFWSGIPFFTKFKLIALCSVVPLFAIAVVATPSDSGPRMSSTALEANSPLRLWVRTSPGAKHAWAKGYTQEHLGFDDGSRANEIVEFLDASARTQQERVQDPRALEVLMNGDIRLMFRAGAAPMGWPASQAPE